MPFVSPGAFRKKVVRGKPVLQMTGSSRRKMLTRLRRLAAANPDPEGEVAGMRAAYERHKRSANDPHFAGTYAQKESKALLPHGRKVVRIAERRLKQLKRLKEVTK